MRDSAPKTIANLATTSGMSVHTLRYYERIGLLEPVARNESGHRIYDDFAMEWVTLLKHLRQTGMPIRDMQAFASLVRSGEESVPERIELLEQHQASILEQIGELQVALEHVEEKLAAYRMGDAVTPTRGDES